ncbi:MULTISPECIES: hypothetical protein [Vibrio]|uniref:hypothetical protein n=1 Tax=Vibrio TaxID=662 RepID=UPI00078B1C58|nr:MULTISPECIES: hypothetical protein [Vibrio]BAU70879.1 hypothetical protein [Vibrio sp. 04Ya108]BBM67865.1 hypothetical protein VA249_45110 [Vibrio alfacsensis]BCN27034.1 hypothetical protein VYA_42260 [Vibrio alfacsensis]
MKTIYAETLKLTDYLELERPYDFTERHNNLNEEAQELIFSSAFVVYNQLLSELGRPAIAKQNLYYQAKHITQTPFPLWLTSLSISENAISPSLCSRMTNATKAMFSSCTTQDVLHRILYDVCEQLKREISVRIEQDKADLLGSIEESWGILNLAIYRVVRDLNTESTCQN